MYCVCFFFSRHNRDTRASFNRGSFNRGSFSRGLSGTVLVDGDEVLTTKGRRRRSCRRLSISQNGMVPLPASAGIPPSDLGASGSCSLPRYSRFSKQHFGGGSAVSIYLVDPAPAQIVVYGKHTHAELCICMYVCLYFSVYVP